MRPPDDWHIIRRRSAPPWWLALPAGVALVVALAIGMCTSGGSTSPPSSAANDPCATDGCPTATDEGPVYSGSGSESAAPPVTGEAAAVLDVDCGTLLYGKNASERLPPASLVKIATALVAIERGDLDRVVPIKVNSELLVASTASTVMGLEPGQRLTMRDLLHGLLLASGNDAAIAIAEEIAGNEPAFVELMNAKAAELGLADTHFSNSHGLDEPKLYSSAFDMALLGRALLANGELAAIVRTKSYQPSWDGPMVWNGNGLLDLYPWALGIKIGLTEDAGQTIVAAAEAQGRTLIVTVLGSQSRYSDAIALFEWAFAETGSACEA